MTYSSNVLYQPSILELAQAGNCRALTYWINSLLGPQGIYVQVQSTSTPSRFLRILVDFQRPRRREACMHLRDRVVRFICYRLWTLNSEMISGVQISARLAGDPRVLWQQSVRIKVPAHTGKLSQVARSAPAHHSREFRHTRFRIFRALLMSSITISGFFMGYWLFYLQISRVLRKAPASAAFSFEQRDTVQNQGKPNSRQANPKQSDQRKSDQRQSEKPLNQGQFNQAEMAFSAKSIGQAVAIAASLPPQLANDAAIAPSFRLRETQETITIPKAFEGKVVSQVTPSATEKVIALTFDDGPSPKNTPAILDILKQQGVKATFFLLGTNVKKYSELAQRIVNEGHAIGNHSWDHTFNKVDASKASHEIDDTSTLIQEVTGVKPSLFRPPGGFMDTGMATYAQQQKYMITMWSVDPKDYLVSAPILLDNVLRNAKPGRIVLLHDGGGDRSATIQALPQLITALKQQGYTFVTVPELLKHQDPKAQESKPQDPNKGHVALPNIAGA
jgi:peptidoglycan/xylan/chitin deacetylase (PgdA/CDA1 family)